MNKVVVFAGCRSQFDEVARDKLLQARDDGLEIKFNLTDGRFSIGDTDYIYCSDADHSRGMHGVKVEWWGTVEERKDFAKLAIAAKWLEQP